MKLGEILFSDENRAHLAAGETLDAVEGGQRLRFDHGHGQLIAHFEHREQAQPFRFFLGNQFGNDRIDEAVAQDATLYAKSLGEGLYERGCGDGADVHQRAANAAAGGLLFGEGFRQLLLGNQAIPQELFPESRRTVNHQVGHTYPIRTPAYARCLHPHLGCASKSNETAHGVLRFVEESESRCQTGEFQHFTTGWCQFRQLQ